jgi:hypothetical protein
MTILLHGTTLHRANTIARDGPNPRFQEPGGQVCKEGFSFCFQSGLFLFGTPTEYACGKAVAFPNEGGPAILEVHVPDDMIATADNGWFPPSQGIVQFDIGGGIEELLAIWPSLPKRITTPVCP